jgi:hypothetical protein
MSGGVGFDGREGLELSKERSECRCNYVTKVLHPSESLERQEVAVVLAAESARFETLK